MKHLILLFALALITISCQKVIDDVIIYGTIDGNVISSVDGQPVSNVEISAYPAISTIITSTDGKFNFSDVKEGSYTLTTYKTGYKSKSISVQVNSGKTSVANIVLVKENGTDDGNGGNCVVSGTIRDKDNNDNLPNVTIIVVPGEISITSDNNGNYTINNLKAANYSMTFMKTGYTSYSNIFTVVNGINKFDILLSKKSDDPTVGGIILNMPFDGNIIDKTGNCNPQSGDISFVADRKNIPNKAVFFKGNDNSFVLVPPSNLYNQKEFTYSFWIKPSNGLGVEYRGYIDIVSRWGHWGYGAQNYDFAIGPDGSARAIFFNASMDPYYTFVSSNSNIVKANEWTHLAYTYANNRVKIYLNGNIVIDQYCITPQSSNYGIMIGKTYEIIKTYYFGAVDDLLVYNKALTDSEIMQLSK